jgi:hypothetical protein
MLDQNRMMLQLATDLVMTFMPMRGKTREMVEDEIHLVHLCLLEQDQQPPTSGVDDEDALDPETGLLKEASMMPFLERWSREAEADNIRDGEDALEEA